MANSLSRDIVRGERVVLKSNVLKDEYNTLEWRTVEVAGENFGNFEFTSGTCLMVKFKDGEIVRMSGYDLDKKETENLNKQMPL